MCTRRPLSRAETGATKSNERLTREECVKSVPSCSQKGRVLHSTSTQESSSLPLKRSKSGSSRLWPPN